MKWLGICIVLVMIVTVCGQVANRGNFLNRTIDMEMDSVADIEEELIEDMGVRLGTVIGDSVAMTFLHNDVEREFL